MQSYNSRKYDNNLFRAILKLKDLTEARNFFRDLCTIEEIGNMADRWEAAQMIEKKISYREIAKKLKLSTTTVSRVAFWLRNGTGGYKSVLGRLKAGKNNVHHCNPSFGKGQRL